MRAAPILAALLALAACAGSAVPAGDAVSLNALGVQRLDAGDYAQAEPLFRRALAIRQAGPQNRDLVQSLYNLGRLDRLEGRLAEAETLDRRALGVGEAALGPEHPRNAQTLVELATLFQAQGRMAEAGPLYDRALAIQQKSLPPGDRAIGNTLLAIGYFDRVAGRYAEAEARYKQALAIMEQAVGPDHPLVATLATDLGALYGLQRRDAEAEALERRALAIRSKAFGPDHPALADSLTDLGNLYARERRFAEAEASLRGGLAIRQKALGPEHPDIALKSLRGLVDLYVAQGRLPDAVQASDQQVAVLAALLVRGASQRSAAAASERRLYRSAFVENVTLSDPAGRRGDAGALGRGFEAAQFAQASTAGQAVAAMAARFASADDALAARIRGFQDLDDRRRQLDAALLRAASGQGDQGGAGASDGAADRRALDDVQARMDAMQVEIDRQFPAYARLTSPRPLSVATVQGLLAPDEAMLVYLVGKDRGWLWVVRRERADVVGLPIGEQALAEAVTSLRSRLDPWQNPDLLAFDAAEAYALYQRVLAPAATLLAGVRHVLVVPDGALQSLPLAVLVTQPPPAHPATLADNARVAWFVRDHAITVLPTVGSLQALRAFAAPSRASAPFLGIGNPVLSSQPASERGNPRGLGRALAPPVRIGQAGPWRGAGIQAGAGEGGAEGKAGGEQVPSDVRSLPSLPETAVELRLVAKVLGAPEASLYLGQRASEPVVLAAHPERFRVVEFATHGLMSGDLGLAEPALVLTPPPVAEPDDDGLLTASRIATMKFDADWVVLSACNTASGDGTPDGGGLSGLARAFFYAGARSVLVSNWSVPSVAAVKLTTGAFAALASDPAIGRAEALRRSMLAMIDATDIPEFSHPMAWAPFILAGEGGAGH